MRFSPLNILSLLGTAHAGLGPLTLTYDETPLATSSVIPGFEGCQLTGPTQALSKFRDYIRARQVYGPCRFTMDRTSTGWLPPYLEKEKQPTNNYTSILFTLEAPAELETYIKHIEIIQEGPGSDCSSARLSYVAKNDEGEPRYISLNPAGNPTLPEWIPEFMHQIKEGDYLLEVPSTCSLDPQTLNIRTFHTYENVASQLRLLRHTSKISADPQQCQLEGALTRIMSYRQYHERVQSLPRTCQYRWSRDYRSTVPATHISTESGKTTVLAQIALNEPMLGDQRRRILMVKLGTTSGTACAQSAVYARKKGLPLDENHWKLDREENLYGDAASADDSIAIDIPWEMRDTSYDFYFVLPKECKLTNPVLTTKYEDDNNLLSEHW